MRPNEKKINYRIISILFTDAKDSKKDEEEKDEDANDGKGDDSPAPMETNEENQKETS